MWVIAGERKCELWDALAAAWRGPAFWSPTIGRQAGVFVLISEFFQGKVLQWRRDASGRVIGLLLDCNSHKLNIITIYAPTIFADRKMFSEHLHKYFLPSDAVLIAGEFNCYEIALAVISSLSRIFLIFVNLLIFDFSIGSCLNKFFVSRLFLPCVRFFEKFPCCFSDHDFVHLSVQLDDSRSRGPGLWKFNN